MKIKKCFIGYKGKKKIYGDRHFFLVSIFWPKNEICGICGFVRKNTIKK